MPTAKTSRWERPRTDRSASGLPEATRDQVPEGGGVGSGSHPPSSAANSTSNGNRDMSSPRQMPPDYHGTPCGDEGGNPGGTYPHPNPLPAGEGGLREGVLR